MKLIELLWAAAIPLTFCLPSEHNTITLSIIYTLLLLALVSESIERTFIQRRVWVNHFLLKESRTYHFLKGGLLLATLQLLTAALLPLFLIACMFSMHIFDWIALGLSFFLMALLRGLWRRSVEGTFNVAHRDYVCRRLTHWSSLLIIPPLLIIAKLYTPHPSVVGFSIVKVLQLAEAQIANVPEGFAMIAQWSAYFDHLSMWAIQNLSHSQPDLLSKALQYFMVFALALHAAAFIFTFQRVLTGISSLAQWRDLTRVLNDLENEKR